MKEVIPNMEEQIEDGFRQGFRRDMTPYLQKRKGVGPMRQYDILEKIATRLAQYELPGEYTSKKNREKFHEKYVELHEKVMKFYRDSIDKDYPEPTVK